MALKLAPGPPHTAALTTLHFSSRATLLSTAGDNTLTLTRTKDWTTLQTLRAPAPRGARPSGDTSSAGDAPAGVLAAGVHPSARALLTVSRGERCMRSWDLIRGKRGAVLTFDKTLLSALGESARSLPGPGAGEARDIAWPPGGEQFALAFERGVALFGLDSTPLAVLRPMPRTKVHRVCYVSVGEESVLAVATEDGRVILFETDVEGEEGDAVLPSPPTMPAGEPVQMSALPRARQLGQLSPDAKTAGVTSRVKDLAVVAKPGGAEGEVWIVTACSDGAIRVWDVAVAELLHGKESESEAVTKTNGDAESGSRMESVETKQVGKLLGTYETGTRITCLTAFALGGAVQSRPKQSGGVLAPDVEDV